MSGRRLPVYLLLDCSESMAGPAIESVSRGVSSLLAALRQSPHALESVYLSVIQFSKDARQTVPLTEVAEVQLPTFRVRPGTALGAALSLLLERLSSEVVRTTVDRRGDYRPLVFLLTDGQPTDDWQPHAAQLKSMKAPRVANFYAIGCGPDVDYEVLHEISDIVLQMDDLSPEAFEKFFVWLTASVQSASAGLTDTASDMKVDLDNLPDGVLAKTPDHTPQRLATPRQVFLHALCSRNRKPYLMRFSWNEEIERYVAVASHPLDEAEPDDMQGLPAVNSSLILGCPPCPYCDSSRAGVCACGAVFCDGGDGRDSVICPKCHSRLTYGGQQDFDITQSAG